MQSYWTKVIECAVLLNISHYERGSITWKRRDSAFSDVFFGVVESRHFSIQYFTFWNQKKWRVECLSLWKKEKRSLCILFYFDTLGCCIDKNKCESRKSWKERCWILMDLRRTDTVSFSHRFLQESHLLIGSPSTTGYFCGFFSASVFVPLLI